MVSIFGIFVTLAMVFGGYLAAGGKMQIIMKALPFEMMMIGGAAVGGFILANEMRTVKHTLKDLKKIISGAKWKQGDYESALCLIYELVRLSRKDPVAIETHIDAPQESDIFQKYPTIVSDGEFVGLICDTIRSAGLNYDDPMQVEEVLEKRIAEIENESLHSSHALQTMADGLPALGIVAAVLGVIKTMGSIDQPPEVLGKLIGGALVGTFLGVFLAYALVGPFSNKVKSVVLEDINLYRLVREVLVASFHNHSPEACAEVGRQCLPHHLRPSFQELDDRLSEIRRA